MLDRLSSPLSIRQSKQQCRGQTECDRNSNKSPNQSCAGGVWRHKVARLQSRRCLGVANVIRANNQSTDHSGQTCDGRQMLTKVAETMDERGNDPETQSK